MHSGRISELIQSRKPVESYHGIVATGHPLSAQAGGWVLEKGGNAFDAAAAAIFASWVVEPASCGLGGIGQGNVFIEAAGEVKTLQARAVPRHATEDMFALEPGLDPWGRWRKVRDDANMIGPRAPMIPGLLAGICDIVSGLGSMELAELLQPAIAYSRDGIPVDGYHVLHVASNFTRLRQYDETARIFLPNGAPPRASSFHQTGSRLVQADLARSLEDIAKGGPDVFYKGELAERIAQYIAANGGILDYHDLATYRPSFELAERRSTYRDTEQIRTDGYFVPLILNILEHFDLRSYEPRAPEYLHLVIEATRYAFASLLEYLADPQIKPSPIEGLWSKDFSAEIATRIDRKRAAEDVQPVDPWPFETRITGQERPAEDPIEPSRSNHDPGTTQVIAADEAGNVATFNLTHSGAFGSMVTVPGTGILLNGAMTSMDPEPGKAHSIHPNRRQMNFCAPVLVLSRGAPFFAFSGSGGRSIISCQTYVLSHMIDHQMTGQEAIEAPRTHCETRQVFVDSRVGRSAIRDLRAIGHNLEVVEETFYAPYFARPVVIEKVDGDPPHYRSGISQCHRAAAVGL